MLNILSIDGQASSIDFDELIKKPLRELINISEKCMRIELRAIKSDY